MQRFAAVATFAGYQQRGVTIALAQADDVRPALDCLGITARIGAAQLFTTVQEAMDALNAERGPAPPTAAQPEA